ncbi:MAG: molybdopterin molybdenumtransferase MoeA [Betaproteobacteria bacterium]|nr:molybdopterin molybdenumtransferase MoeA [Betaproteobacteria bacterium]
MQVNTSRPPLKSLDAALAELLAHAQPLKGIEEVNTFDADGRVLASDVLSPLQVPPLDNSAMDGYAVRCADTATPNAVLQVTQRIPAGSVGTLLAAGQCARIFTGAPIPPGSDAVVMQEDCMVLDPSDHPIPSIQVRSSPTAGQWIRRAGEDVTQGARVLSRGQRLSPASLGLAASMGLSTLSVAGRPKVALFSTGDELVMPGDITPEHMPVGAIYNSNRFFLRALLNRLGCDVTDYGILPDQREATLNALRDAAAHHDLILTSGGVSVGEEDHIKPALQQLGQLDLWQIAIKPGKPFAYGKIHRTSDSDCHFCGLPGNPVSSFMTFLLLVRPFLLRLQGCIKLAPQTLPLVAHFNWPRADKRQEFLRVQLNGLGGLELFPNQSSGVLTSAVWGDGVVNNPAGQTIAYGDMVEFISFANWLN